MNFSSSGTDSGNITVSSGNTGIINVPSGDTVTLSGTLNKNGADLIFAGGGSLVINGQITGTSPNSDASFTTNTTLNNSNNNYNGNTYIYEGATVTSGVTNAMPITTTLTLGSPSDNSTGSYNLSGYSQTLAGLLTAGTGTGNSVTDSGGTATLSLNNSTSDAFNGTISGANLSLAMEGAGTFTLSGTNSYGGGTGITSGTLSVSADNNLGASTGGVSVSGGGTLAVSSGFTSSRNFSFGSGGGDISVSSGQTFTASGTGTWSSTSGGSLTLNGPGTVELLATSNGGSYGQSGSPLSVTAANGILSGTATVLGNITINSGGTVAPGTSTTSPGVLTFSGTGTLDPGGHFTVDLTNAGGSAGSGWNELSVTRLVAGSGLSSSNKFDVAIGTFNTTGFNSNQTYTWDIITGAGASSLAGDFSLTTTGHG